MGQVRDRFRLNIPDDIRKVIEGTKPSMLSNMPRLLHHHGMTIRESELSLRHADDHAQRREWVYDTKIEAWVRKEDRDDGRNYCWNERDSRNSPYSNPPSYALRGVDVARLCAQPSTRPTNRPQSSTQPRAITESAQQRWPTTGTWDEEVQEVSPPTSQRRRESQRSHRPRSTSRGRDRNSRQRIASGDRGPPDRRTSAQQAPYQGGW